MKKYELLTSDDNIFNTINDDWLGRNSKIINLMKLLNNVDENIIISIDGEWGTGKTFFIKQLIYICNNHDKIGNIKVHKDYAKVEEFSKKHVPVYYNAWENDNHDNPLESLIYNILNEYPKYKNHIENPEELFQAVKPILKNIIEKGSLGYITKDCFENLKSFEDLADSIVTIEEKQSSLNKLFNKIIKSDQRVLLVVDELDRCRPDYAVKLLETLKHFYNNSKLSIIVVTNNKQLSHTIKKYYGNDFDGYSYLNKIYDSVITLGIDNLENYVKKHCEITQATNLPENISFELFKYLNFSYRECNKYMSMYRIVEPYTKVRDSFNMNKFLFEADILLPMALALKIKNINNYNSFITGIGDEIIKSFLAFLRNDNDELDYIRWLSELLSPSENETLEETFIRKYRYVFSKRTSYNNFPYLEAISMLGNSINFGNSNNQSIGME